MTTDFVPRADEMFIRWIRLRCPTCSTLVLALAGPATPSVFCPRPKCALALLCVVDWQRQLGKDRSA